MIYNVKKYTSKDKWSSDLYLLFLTIFMTKKHIFVLKKLYKHIFC